VLLALAAVPPQVRPAFLAGPGDAARVLLRAIAIRPGVAVFEASSQPTTRLVRNDCLRVRGIDATGRVAVVAPPEGRCVLGGVRAAVPWTEGLLRSLVLRAPAGVAEPALGDWVCHAPRFTASAFREVELVWTAPWVDRATGAEGVANDALVVWRCDPPALVQRVLQPSDAALRERPPGG
jgi:hypothetical protein